MKISMESMNSRKEIITLCKSIPATMCKATQISPTTVIAMYAASVRRNGSMMSRPQLPPLPGAPVTGSMTGNGIMSQPPRPNGFHVPCPVAPLLRAAVKDSTTNNAVVVVNVVNKS